MPFYNRMSAALYAMKYALAPNKKWPDYAHPHGHGDCTNFVSQALFVGGWEMIYGPQIGTGLEWYCWPDDRGNRSKSWASADWFSDFLEWSFRAERCDLADLMIGDLVQEKISDYGVRHTMIVTNIGPSDIYLTYHSSNYLNTSFTSVQTRVGQDDSFIFWKMKDQYPWSMKHGSGLFFTRDQWDYARTPKPENMW